MIPSERASVSAAASPPPPPAAPLSGGELMATPHVAPVGARTDGTAGRVTADSAGRSRGRRVRARLSSPGALRDAFLLYEILGPPVALRPDDPRVGGW